MKKLSYFFLVLITSSFIACSSDSSSSSNGDQLYVKFTVNGVNYDLEPETITSLQKLIAGSQDVDNIFTRLSLWMPVTLTIGSHAITDDAPSDSNIATLHNADLWVGDDTYTATTGTLVVTELTNDIVKGTFTFTGDDGNGVMVTVTNGSFRAYR